MSETLKALTKAFIGESQARNRYTFYASKARQEGFLQISDIFTLTANQEKEHSSQLFKMIQQIKGDETKIEVPAEALFAVGDTKENLKAAIEGENYEKSVMYPNFAKIARDEGFEEIATKLELIAVAENHHSERYSKLLKNVQNGTVFKRDTEVMWVCAECGYVHYGKEAPKECPCCGHPQGYYSVMCEEY